MNHPEEIKKAQTIFKSVVKNVNILTPNILDYVIIPNGVIEISKGKGLTGDILFGVTVVENNQHNYEKSTCFHSESELISYVNELKNQNYE